MRITLAAISLCTALIASACAAELPTPSPRPSGAPSSQPTATTASPTGTPGEPTGTPTGPTASPSPTEPGQSPTPPPSPTPTPTLAPGAFDPNHVLVALESVAIFGVDHPVQVTNAGDGTNRLFIVQRGGLIRIMHQDGSILPQPFLDLTGVVDVQDERGLFAVAFHPDFANNGKFYVQYADSHGHQFVDQFVAQGDGPVAADSGKTILEIDMPGTNDLGGWLGFGPDGDLYIAVGDGGGFSDISRTGQDPSDLLGSILRIDVDHGDPYSIPADNPFADGVNGAPEVWAYGLRDPWRASFDRKTGDLWIGDVGATKWEEVDVDPAGVGGLNFGWSDIEGLVCFRKPNCNHAGETPPVAVYHHERGYCSITGGYVYRGSVYPFLDGAYMYADFCKGNIFAFDSATAIATGSVDRPKKVAPLGYRVDSFGEDEAGELYLVDYNGGIYRVRAVQIP